MDDLGFLGSIDLEGTLRLALQCRSSSIPTSPDASPSWAIYGSSDTALLTGSLGASDADSKTGFRTGDAAITAANGFASGNRYTIRFAYAISSAARAALAHFQVT